MPRKLSDEELDAGRIAGLLKRSDPDLWERLRQEAEARGLKISDLIVQLVRRGIEYESYNELTGKHIMQCLDILDRIYGYMHGWMSQTNLQNILSTMDLAAEVTKRLAPAMGYYSEEEVKRLVEQVAEKVKNETMQQAKKEGPLTKAFIKFVDSAAQEAAKAIIEEARRRGLLSELANVVMSSAREALEEGGGGGEGQM